MPTLVQNHRDPQKNWSASGLGDLLSTLGAIAERNIDSRAGPAVFEKGAPLCMAALDWVDGIEYPFDDDALVTLGKLLHTFSIVGHVTAPVGSEHSLYYALKERHNLPKMIATHGKIVAAASLWPLRAWCAQSGDSALLNMIVRVFEKVGLPISLFDLEQLGVNRAILRDAIASTESMFFAKQLLKKGPDWFLQHD